MNFAEMFLGEFEHEMQGTRKILERVPDSLMSWKAHESLNSIGWVASHLVDTMSWTEVIVKEESFDVAPVDGPPHTTPMIEAAANLVSLFDANVASAKQIIATAPDEDFGVPWTLKQGGQDLFTLPRAAVVKSFLLNHMIHHRAFLVAYLRMNDVECPGLYE